MCGRFNTVDTPGLQALLRMLGVGLSPLPSRYNIAPTETVGLIGATGDAGLGLQAARWWLTPSWATEVSQKYAMFNARSEGLSKSPAFRKPFASQRGIVPMSSFIEWRGVSGDKQPWLVSNDAQAIAVAALWDVWPGSPDSGAAGGSGPLLSCTLVTTAAAEAFQPWHSRMPVMLTPDECGRWMDNTATIEADDSMFLPKLREPLTLVPIDKAVGNARTKNPDCVQASGSVVRLPTDS